MRAVIAIPARYGSTRLPGKALAAIGDDPMVVRVWRRCRLVRGIERVLVATDDARIRDAVVGAGGEAVLTGAHHVSGTDRIAEALRGEDYDLAVNVQGDEPFVDPGAVEALLAACSGEGAPEAATLAVPVRSARELFDTSVVKVHVAAGGDAVYFSRFPVPFRAEHWRVGPDAWRPAPSASAAPLGLRHVGVYAFRREFLERFTRLAPAAGELAERLEQLRVIEHGHRMRVVTTQWEPLGVDTAEDLEAARRRAAAERPG